MKQVMKSLKHNGIFVPTYDYKGFSIKINGQPAKLTSKSEQMAVAWVEKLSQPYLRQTKFSSTISCGNF